MSGLLRSAVASCRRMVIGGFRLCVGWLAANRLLAPMRGFDPKFYLRAYPEIAHAGINPALHYFQHGRHEGRMPRLPELPSLGSIKDEFDENHENVLVVTHESSRTGAPILSLNLVRILRRRHNVLVFTLRGGPLINLFRSLGAVVIEWPGTRCDPVLAELLLERIMRDCQFSFALVNSIESRVVLPALATYYIPSVLLVHEFAAYTRPRNAFREALFWAGEAVFSAQITLQNALDQYPDMKHRLTSVLPQGRCLLPTLEVSPGIRAAELNRLRKAFCPATGSRPLFIVLGAGYVQLRKGVDLFIECASVVFRLAPTADIQFVWVGRGYDPERDAYYSAYLADQVHRAGLNRRVSFIGETSEMGEVYTRSDLLLLTSRLDPLPNVAIDALSEGLPVLCFDKTTGIADILTAQGMREACVADYLDTHALAHKVLRLASDSIHYRHISEQCRQFSASIFNMENYVAELKQLAAHAAIRIRQERQDVATILESNLMDMSFVCAPHCRNQPAETVVREYVRAWASGIGRRKPFPGFHPEVYSEQHGLESPDIDPFADYIRAGMPPGPWLSPMAQDVHLGESASLSGLKIALHLHIFYPELLPDILSRLAKNCVRPELFVSVSSDHHIKDVARQLGSYLGQVKALEVVPNRGRDIGPLLTMFAPEISSNYDLVGHIHTKKSIDAGDPSVGAVWYQFLLDNLLGGKSGAEMDHILDVLSSSSKIGMIFPADPNVIDWGDNKPFAQKFAACLDIREIPDDIVFPVGTMFWARVSALSRFWALGLGWNDYPEEPLPYDGSMLHALERLFPLGLAEESSQCVLTSVAGVSR